MIEPKLLMLLAVGTLLLMNGLLDVARRRWSGGLLTTPAQLPSASESDAE
jgi:hypothetical protein